MVVRVRKATAADLPSIHNLIRQSFAAMIPHSCLPSSIWHNGAHKLVTSELDPKNFETAYFNDQVNGNYFLVAEDTILDTDALEIVGCVGIKREDAEKNSMELVRMAVHEKCRGRGVGKSLFTELLNVCKSRQGVKSIFLVTGNPDSVKFYAKLGFEMSNRILFWYGVYQIK